MNTIEDAVNGVEKAVNGVTALGTIIMHIVWGKLNKPHVVFAAYHLIKFVTF